MSNPGVKDIGMVQFFLPVVAPGPLLLVPIAVIVLSQVNIDI